MSISASTTTTLLTFTQTGYSFNVAGQLRVWFYDGSYPSGTVSIIANLAGHTAVGLSSFINDLNTVDLAEAQNGSIDVSLTTSSTKTNGSANGVLNVRLVFSHTLFL